MAYFAPYVDATGLHTPTYQDIEDYLVEQAKSIFGADIYLGNDSQDFQDIAARAQAIHDTFASIELAYNAHSPASAIGTSLDALVALNGLHRKPETNSTAPVTLTGTAYAVINGGVVADTHGKLWALPDEVVLSVAGTANVTAVAIEPGAIAALAGEINLIMTPTSGWTSVTNPIAATTGQAIETDSQLRARQAISVANPSQALTTGILGGVLSIENVVSAQLYENDTSTPAATIGGVSNPGNFPAHSITLVVDGGDATEIASEIHRRKTPGCYTDGDVITTIYDQYSIPNTIRFYRPVAVPVEVKLHIKGLTGYSAAVGNAAAQAVADYLNARTPGQSVIISELWQAALSADPNAYPVFSLTEVEAGKWVSGGTSFATTDIALTFKEKATGDFDLVTLVVTL